MSLKDHLLTLKWNSFSVYPKQGENIFLHCTSADGKIHRFVKIKNFNAAQLDLGKIAQNVLPNQQCLYTWLPADEITEDYV